MKKLIVILAIVACATIAQAQTYDANGNYIGYGNSYQAPEPTPWPTRSYNEPPLYPPDYFTIKPFEMPEGPTHGYKGLRNYDINTGLRGPNKYYNNNW